MSSVDQLEQMIAKLDEQRKQLREAIKSHLVLSISTEPEDWMKGVDILEGTLIATRVDPITDKEDDPLSLCD